VAAPLSAKDTLDLQDAHRDALALIEAASMGAGGFMGALGTTALATTAVAGTGAAGGGGGGQRTSAALAAASVVARQERALKWSQGVLARALETREASFRSVQAVASGADLSAFNTRESYVVSYSSQPAQMPHFSWQLVVPRVLQ
jgi:hypothetical protein